MIKFNKIILSALTLGFCLLSSVYADPKVVTYRLSHKDNAFYRVKANSASLDNLNDLTINVVCSSSVREFPYVIPCSGSNFSLDLFQAICSSQMMARSKSTDTLVKTVVIDDFNDMSPLCLSSNDE